MVKILSITSTEVVAGADNSIDLGTLSTQFKDLYITGTAFIDSIGESIGFADNINFTFGTGTGVKIGSATNQKIAFYNVTPVTQRVSTSDLRQTLIDYGLLASGGATPLNLNGGALIATGSNTLGQTFFNNVNLIFSTGTGTKIATTTAQKISFWNATPVVQPTSLTGSETSITFSAPTTPDYAIQALTDTSPFGFVTADEGATLLSVVSNLQVRVQELESKLQSIGLIA